MNTRFYHMLLCLAVIFTVQTTVTAQEASHGDSDEAQGKYSPDGQFIAADAALPVPVNAPVPGMTEYDVTMQMGQKTMEMSMTSKIEDGGDHWILTDISSSPMGDMTDIALLKKGSLEAISRKLTRGPMIVDVAHDESGAIEGNIMMRGKNIPIQAPDAHPVFGDGTAMGVILAQLPLEKGYSELYRTFDPQRQKIVNYRLTVTGSEEVITANGKVDSHALLIEDLEGSGSKTYMWMSKGDNPKLLKMKATLASMGGAKMTVNIK